MERMFFYGSLRSGFYNNERMLRWGTVRKLSKEPEAIAGWDLFDLGSYPTAIVHGGPHGLHRLLWGEVWELDQNAAKMVETMEQGAGYYLEVVNTSFGPASIWVMEGPPMFGHRIASGDWTNKDKKGPEIAMSSPSNQILQSTIFDSPPSSFTTLAQGWDPLPEED